MTAAADVEKHRRRLFEHQLYQLTVLINRVLLRPQDFPSFDEAYPDPDESEQSPVVEPWESVRDYMRSAAIYNKRKRGEGT